MSEWISVEDRLPSPGIDVLVWIEQPCIASIDDEGDFRDHDYYTIVPSHWMPLPEPPK